MGDPIDNYLDQIMGEPPIDDGGRQLGGGADTTGPYLTLEQLSQLAARHGGLVGRTVVNPTSKDSTGMFMETNPSPTYRYVFADGSYLLGESVGDLNQDMNQWAIKGVRVSGPSTALGSGKEPSATAQWSLRQGQDGRTYRVNELTGEAKLVEGLPADPNADARRRLLEAQTAAALRGPLGRQLTPAELELQQLQVQKARQDLMNPMLLAQQQLDEVITNLAQQYAEGRISLAERDRMLDLTKQAYTANLQGTTPWQMKTNQATIANNLLGNESQLGGSLASSLLSNLTSLASRIMAGPTPLPDIDPFALAKYGQQQLGAGPDISAAARNIMSGFLKPWE